jgi:uncharacterized repeat protein (TIGR01451 family)
MSRHHRLVGMPRRRYHAALVGVLATTVAALGSLVAVPTPAGAAAAPASKAAPAVTPAVASATDSATFTCTGYAQHWAVPYDVTSLTFDAIGAAGNQENTNNNYGTPGNGAEVQGTVPVTPGEVLTISVGCAGVFSTSAFGYTPGGQAGNSGMGGQLGTAGGSSTGVVGGTGEVLLVAGGGGGGGGQAGGLGNSTGGAGGSASSNDTSAGANGNFGTGPCPQAPGGLGGSGTPSSANSGNGQGGQDAISTGGGTGGGGGGGYVGGGGGGSADYLCAGGGGGAGSSYLPPAATGVSYTNTTSPGQVIITYTSSLPASTVQSDTCTGAGDTYTVPGNVNEINVLAVGAVGGSGLTATTGMQPAGAGQLIDVAVTPGAVLTVAAGCTGTFAGASKQSTQEPGGFGLGSGGSGGAGTAGGSSDGSGSGGGGSSGIMTAGGTVLVEAAGGGGLGGAGCTTGTPAPYTGCSGNGNPGSGSGGALGAPGNDIQGQDATDGLVEQAGGGGGGSTYGPGGGGGASTPGSGNGGSGGGGLSYPAATENYSNNWGDGNVDPANWYEFGEMTTQAGITFDSGMNGILDISPVGYVVPTADLAVSVTAEVATPNLGDLDTYDIKLTNNGPDAASAITVSNSLPSGIRVTGYSVPSGTSYNESTGAWTVPSLASGQSLLLELTEDVTSYGTFRDVSQVTSSGPSTDPTPGNNVSNAEFTTAAADVAVTVSVATSLNADGQNVDTYTVDAINNGPTGANGTAVTNTLPATFVYQSATAPPGTSVTGSSTSTQQQWSIGYLGSGQQDTLTIVADDPSNTGGTDTATISATSPSDPDPSNNTATATTTEADLAVTDSVSTTYNGQGGTVDTYTIYASNYGPGDANGVIVTNTLPNDYVYQSSSASTGVVTGDPGSALQQWDIGTLPMDSSQSLTVVAGDPQDIGGIDSVSIQSSTADPDSGNNGATATTGPDTDVGTTTAAGSSHATVGQTVSFSTDVFNHGSANLASGTVAVVLPADLAFVSSDSVGNYDSATRTFTFQVSDVGPYDQAYETLQATVLEPADPTNATDRVATVTSTLSNTDPAYNSPGDATSFATTTIDPTALTLTPAASQIAPGATVAYTAMGTDPNGVSDGDVTSETMFSISPTAGSTGSATGASCTDNVCTAQTPGGYTVTATDGDTTATATITVAQTAWARPASSGLPKLKKMSPATFAIGVHGEHWELRVTQPNNSTADVFTATITLNQGSFSDVKGILLEHADSYTVNGGQITLRFRDAAEIDGLSWITPAVATTITFDLSFNGQPATADQIRLGPSGVAATSDSPLTINRVPA